MITIVAFSVLSDPVKVVNMYMFAVTVAMLKQLHLDLRLGDAVHAMHLMDGRKSVKQAKRDTAVKNVVQEFELSRMPVPQDVLKAAVTHGQPISKEITY